MPLDPGVGRGIRHDNLQGRRHARQRRSDPANTRAGSEHHARYHGDRRRLPAEQTVQLVIGMAMMRNQSVERVAAMLNIALP